MFVCLYVCNLEFIFTGFFIGNIYDNIEDVEEHSRLGISTSSRFIIMFFSIAIQFECQVH